MEILGIVGRQNSGKTTLITQLIPALKALGLRVSTVKHSHHGFEIDKLAANFRFAFRPDDLKGCYAFLHQAHAGLECGAVVLSISSAFQPAPMPRITRPLDN